MVLYPVLFASFGLDDMQIGVLIGATIHDVAQVVGAGYAVSEDAGNVATYVKLLRVACLPVAVLAYALIMRRAARAGGGGLEEAAAPFPWFAVAFAAILIVNSLGWIPETVRMGMDWTSRWLLIAAIAGWGITRKPAAA
ncbi:MAG: putative sulfate exporter family transporter, partial [Pseudomonadota bacterium]